MAGSYAIVTDDLPVENIVAQLNAITDFPASIRIYDRIIQVHSPNERWCFVHALEVGFYLGLDFCEKSHSNEKT